MADAWMSLHFAGQIHLESSEEIQNGRLQACVYPMETGTKLSVQDEGVKIDGTLYRQLVGSLIYLTTTRLDIIFAVGIISKFMVDPKQIHWLAAKQILRYL